jgi:putative ABC transport system permease protein
MSHGEVFRVALGELGTQLVAAIPVGWLLGWWMAKVTARFASSDLFRIPAAIVPGTYVFAATVVAASFLLVLLNVRHRIGRLDLVATLKTKE